MLGSGGGLDRGHHLAAIASDVLSQQCEVIRIGFEGQDVERYFRHPFDDQGIPADIGTHVEDHVAGFEPDVVRQAATCLGLLSPVLVQVSSEYLIGMDLQSEVKLRDAGFQKGRAQDPTVDKVGSRPQVQHGAEAYQNGAGPAQPARARYRSAACRQ